MEQRYLYHNFPRRDNGDIDKALMILKSIKNHGLLLVPEHVEWMLPLEEEQPPRPFEVTQKRICFTDLAPNEVHEHAETFGMFSLEFDIDKLRHFGALPVIYVPQPIVGFDSASPAGTALLAGLFDANFILKKLAHMHWVTSQDVPDTESFTVSYSFQRDNETREFILGRGETKALLRALADRTTPFNDLFHLTEALKGLFYHTDDARHNQELRYYQQREWRILNGFAVHGQVLTQPVSDLLREELEAIDGEFFNRVIQGDEALVPLLSLCTIFPGMNGQKVIEMVRRVIVPSEAIDRVLELLADLQNPPAVISYEQI
jgi:hypothetical protein